MTRRLLPLKRHKIDILGVGVDDISQQEAVFAILRLAQDQRKSHYVVTVNSEFVMLARKNKDFAQILKNADLALADGWWVAQSKLIFEGKRRERIAGVDLVKNLCYEACQKTITVGFLGGFGDVAQRVAERQKMNFPKLKVAFAGPGNPTIGYDSRLKIDLGKAGRIDILFVAYGMGQQEFWIGRNLKKLNVGVFIGVGGAFDYISRVKRRAPEFLQNLGFEWLWRLINEPQRIWRMRVLPVFLTLIIIKFLRGKIAYKS